MVLPTAWQLQGQSHLTARWQGGPYNEEEAEEAEEKKKEEKTPIDGEICIISRKILHSAIDTQKQINWWNN